MSGYCLPRAVRDDYIMRHREGIVSVGAVAGSEPSPASALPPVRSPATALPAELPASRSPVRRPRFNATPQGIKISILSRTAGRGRRNECQGKLLNGSQGVTGRSHCRARSFTRSVRRKKLQSGALYLSGSTGAARQARKQTPPDGSQNANPHQWASSQEM